VSLFLSEAVESASAHPSLVNQKSPSMDITGVEPR
jgi:hypothetical protein